MNLPNWLKWVMIIVLLIGAPVWLVEHPESYTPPVQFLLSIFLGLLSYALGFSEEIQRATKKANDRWLPQAESVILRLLTLRANVCRFSKSTKCSCSASNCDLPELQKEELRAVRVKMKTECEASCQRLDDIAHQLEDAIADWQRFVSANCQGEECNRIWVAIQEREQKLQFESNEQAGKMAQGNFSPS